MRASRLLAFLAAMGMATLAFSAVGVRAGEVEGEPTFPRLRAGDPAVIRRANAALARREREDRRERATCLSMPGPGSADPVGTRQPYSETVTTTFASPLFLSVDVRVNSVCGPYPNNDVPRPISLDLRTGSTLSWRHVFRPGFLPPPDGNSGQPTGSRLASLYLERYRTGPGINPEQCREEIAAETEWALWLTPRGLAAEPLLPHPVRSCAEAATLGIREIAPYIADGGLLRDLADASR